MVWERAAEAVRGPGVQPVVEVSGAPLCPTSVDGAQDGEWAALVGMRLGYQRDFGNSVAVQGGRGSRRVGGVASQPVARRGQRCP